MVNEDYEQLNHNPSFNQHYHHQQQQQQQQQPTMNLNLSEVITAKSSSSSPIDSKFQPVPSEPGCSGSTSSSKINLNQTIPSKSQSSSGPSEFVKKLYKMLEEPESESVVGWGAQRTTLVIKDQILFQRNILPKHFKHSNFASFVRQLNKYDFRKIKVSSALNHQPQNNNNNNNNQNSDLQIPIGQALNAPNNQNAGSLQWEFYHPYFRADTWSELDHIKRKVPATRQKPVENPPQTECLSSCSSERTEDIVNRLMSHQIETTSALNQLTKQCQSLREKLDQAHNRLDLQQRQIDLLTDLNSRHQPSQHHLELPSQPLQNSLTSPKVLDPVDSPEEAPHQSSKPLDHITTSFIMTPAQYFATNLTSMMAPIPRPPTKINSWLGQPRVLIVEDDQICRRISSTILELMGCRIEFACDGVDAVSRMKSRNDANDSFDLVLMDIFMPNMDGLSATSLIRKFDLTTPIISMTSNFQPVDVLKYMNIGMNDCLPKPFTKEGMLIMLQKHLFNPPTGINLITDNNEPESVSINPEPHPPQSSTSPPGSPLRSQPRSQQSLSASTTSSLPYMPDMHRNPKRPCYSQDQADFINNIHLNDRGDRLDSTSFNFNLIDHFHGQTHSHHDSSSPQNPHKRFKV